jgi:hypothetical protein
LSRVTANQKGKMVPRLDNAPESPGRAVAQQVCDEAVCRFVKGDGNDHRDHPQIVTR